jgi:murein DD-endopeptidase MepM/ murein hydrolase activator NlpD
MAKAVSSPLVESFNKIAAYDSNTKRRFVKMKSEYSDYTNFIQRETRQLDATPLPKKRKVKELSTLNAAGLFGSPANLLSAVASGAMDVAGFMGSMFPQKGKQGQPQKVTKPGRVPTVRGGKIRFGGLRAVGILNAVFAGLDFAQGIQEGESVTKAAAGSGGSLAGGILGGIIGQTLIPIPGVGLIAGSSIGSFLGGFLGDRIVENTTEKQNQSSFKKPSDFGFFGTLKSKFDDILVLLGLKKASEDIIKPEDQPDKISGMISPSPSNVKQEGYEKLKRVLPFVTGQVSSYGPAQFGAGRDRDGDGVYEGVHAGQDISGQSAGDPVLAAMAGTVESVSPGYPFQQGYGAGSSQIIKINHSDGTSSRYVHILSDVQPKEEVKTGQKIGTISPPDTASSPGFPHLHFELRNTDGKAIDPRPYLQSAPKVPKVKPANTATATGELDNNSSEVVVFGDSIASGILNESGAKGSAEVGADPTEVLNMLKDNTAMLKDKVVRLSSGISNTPSKEELEVVRRQIRHILQSGGKGVQLMGTSVDRGDLAVMNRELKAIALENPGMVQFTGGFNSNSSDPTLAHPRNYDEYLKKMESLLSSGSGGLGVDPSLLSNTNLVGDNVSYYSSYSVEGMTNIIMIPIAGNTGSSGGRTMVQSSPQIPLSMPHSSISASTMVNSFVSKMLLTNLAET